MKGSECLQLVQDPDTLEPKPSPATDNKVLQLTKDNDECIRQVLEYQRTHDTHCC